MQFKLSYFFQFYSLRNDADALLAASQTYPEALEYLCEQALSLMNVPTQLQCALKGHPHLAEHLIRQLTQHPRHLTRILNTLQDFLSFLFQCEKVIKVEWLPPLLETVLKQPAYRDSFWESRYGLLLANYYFPILKDWWVNALLTIPGKYDKQITTLSNLIHLLEILKEQHAQLLAPVLMSQRRFTALVKSDADFRELQQNTHITSPILQASTLKAAITAQERELSQHKIRQSARILAQAHRCSNNRYLRELPVELLGVIAGHCAETSTLTTEEKTLQGILAVENCVKNKSKQNDSARLN